MASLSVAGERATLALVAEQYATIVDLREALAAARRDLEQEREARLDDLRTHEATLAGLDETSATQTQP